MKIFNSEKICNLCQECGFDEGFCKQEWVKVKEMKQTILDARNSCYGCPDKMKKILLEKLEEKK